MQCRICGNSQGLEIFRVREMMFGSRELFKYFQCPDCGCLQIDEFPADMSKYYSADYYSYNMPVPEGFSLKSFLRKKRDRFAVSGSGISGKILSMMFPSDIIRFYSGIPFDSRILDVGCGSGSLVWRLREAGFSNAIGIDPYIDDTIVYSNGAKVEKRPLSRMEGTWDLVTFHHSFEHISDPEAELSKVRELISDRGTCIIRIPLADSWAWEHYGTNWVQIDAPRHFYLHSVKSMEILAAKTGFAVDHVEYDSTAFQFWGSEQYQKNISLTSVNSYSVSPDTSLFNKKIIKSFERKTKDLNIAGRGDQAAFFLKIK